jgi:hypothetical protein
MDQISRAESWITSGDLDKFHETQSRGTHGTLALFIPFSRCAASAVEQKAGAIGEGHTHYTLTCT